MACISWFTILERILSDVRYRNSKDPSSSIHENQRYIPERLYKTGSSKRRSKRLVKKQSPDFRMATNSPDINPLDNLWCILKRKIVQLKVISL